MENQEKERTWLEIIEEIQGALKPLNWEIMGFDTPLNEPISVKLSRAPLPRKCLGQP